MMMVISVRGGEGREEGLGKKEMCWWR